jgi:hypothetical protein
MVRAEAAGAVQEQKRRAIAGIEQLKINAGYLQYGR